MKFPDILTILDFECPENALKVKTTEVWCLLSLSYLMSMSLKLERCQLSPCQDGHLCFGIHPRQPGTSPLVILDVRLPSSPPWESAVGESTILWGPVSTDPANTFWLHESPFQSFHEPQRPCQIWLEWAWEGEKSDPQSLVLPCQLSSADVMGSTEHKSSRLNSQKTETKRNIWEIS